MRTMSFATVYIQPMLLYPVMLKFVFFHIASWLDIFT